MICATNPTPGEIRASRLAAGLTQKQAGALVSVTLSTWQKWEYGRHPMPKALYNLFLIKTRKGASCSQNQQQERGLHAKKPA